MVERSYWGSTQSTGSHSSAWRTRSIARPYAHFAVEVILFAVSYAHGRSCDKVRESPRELPASRDSRYRLTR